MSGTFVFSTFDPVTSGIVQSVYVNDGGEIVGVVSTETAVTESFISSGTTLSTFSGANTPEITGVNNGGTVIGTETGAPLTQSFIGSPSGTTLSSTTTLISAVAINNGGLVVGDLSNAGFTYQSGSMGGVTSITVPGATQVTLSAVNALGEYVGYYVSNNVSHGLAGAAGLNTTIDPSGSMATTVNAVNSGGELVGQYVDSNGNTDGFIDIGGTFTTLIISGSVQTDAIGVNNAGTVVGTYLGSDFNTHGFIDQNGTITTFDVTGDQDTYVSGITNTGEIYGTWDNPSGAEQGFTATFTPACYCPGTLIRTVAGETAVESLRIGDMVVTGKGEQRPIRWIGRRSYAERFLRGRPELLPVRIAAGALGAFLPHTDLLVSPKHAMFVGGVLVQAEDLVDGVAIRRETGFAVVDYFHVELDSHDVIWANGALSETFVDDGSRGVFANAAEHAALYPAHRDRPAAYCAERVAAGPVLERIRATLGRRAA